MLSLLGKYSIRPTIASKGTLPQLQHGADMHNSGDSNWVTFTYLLHGEVNTTVMYLEVTNSLFTASTQTKLNYVAETKRSWKSLRVLLVFFPISVLPKEISTASPWWSNN